MADLSREPLRNLQEEIRNRKLAAEHKKEEKGTQMKLFLSKEKAAIRFIAKEMDYLLKGVKDSIDFDSFVLKFHIMCDVAEDDFVNVVDFQFVPKKKNKKL